LEPPANPERFNASPLADLRGPSLESELDPWELVLSG
jgi:hypothetical protein